MMTKSLAEIDRKIFNHLFEIAKKSRDKDGVVAACLVRNSEPILSAPSADDGIQHAENIVLELAKQRSLEIQPEDIMYTTLEPCSRRSPEKADLAQDCVTNILENGVRKIVYGAQDDSQNIETQRRLKEAGVSIRQVTDQAIIDRCVDIFNTTVQDANKKK